MNVDDSGVCPTELFVQLTVAIAVDQFAAGNRFDKEIPVRPAETQYHVRYSSLSVYPDPEIRDALLVEEIHFRSGFANLIVNPPRFNSQWTPHPGPWPRVTAPFALGLSKRVGPPQYCSLRSLRPNKDHHEQGQSGAGE